MGVDTSILKLKGPKHDPKKVRVIHAISKESPQVESMGIKPGAEYYPWQLEWQCDKCGFSHSTRSDEECKLFARVNAQRMRCQNELLGNGVVGISPRVHELTKLLYDRTLTLEEKRARLDSFMDKHHI